MSDSIIVSGDGAGLGGSGWAAFMAQFDTFFVLFCTAGLMFVVVSQYIRHRRRQKSLDRMQAHWEAERHLKGEGLGSGPKLRHSAGFWGDG